MILEQLEKGNAILSEIEVCKANITKAEYTQAENVAVRKTYLSVNGIEGSIEVPKSLFRVIGKLILQEHSMKLAELKDRFSEL